MSMKNPLTPAGIKPATYRFVAQHLNHCATAVPDGRGIYSIYYIRCNYMFRYLTMAIFRLYMKYLVSSYTWLMGCIQWYSTGSEVGTRSHMCHGGWEVWVLGVSAIICNV